MDRIRGRFQSPTRVPPRGLGPVHFYALPHFGVKYLALHLHLRSDIWLLLALLAISHSPPLLVSRL